MTRILELPQIERALAGIDVVHVMEDAFAAFARDEYVIPPVGELIFRDPPGDAHIKYGHRIGSGHFVVKVAVGFYDNAALGLPTSSGLMLVFSTKTGMLEAVLLDGGHLTNVRTAAAGALAAKWLAPPLVRRIGICGSGLQAQMQLEHLALVIPCRDVMLWGRNADRTHHLAGRLSADGYSVEIAATPTILGLSCDLIVTATAAHAPLLDVGDVRPGTHISAIGSDTPEKNELSPSLLLSADLLVADSRAQCLERGELAHMPRDGRSPPIRALGEIITGRAAGRTTCEQITICDLTGVAIQDIEISRAVLEAAD